MKSLQDAAEQVIATGRPHSGRSTAYPGGCECEQCEAWDALKTALETPCVPVGASLPPDPPSSGTPEAQAVLTAAAQIIAKFGTTGEEDTDTLRAATAWLTKNGFEHLI